SIPPAARKTTSPPVARTAREAAPPPAKKPAPVKPQSADGILKVSIDPPSALVFVDGEMVTRREMTNGRRVPAGFHDIVAQAAGHEPYQRSFLMEADKTQMMAISLKPKEKGNGQLHVYSYPWSNLYLDGTLIGTTPTPSPITLTSGEHRIVLRREGFKAHQETVRINKDEVTRIQVQLEKEEPEE
ncbi:MAG: PEGA domain-containing protein, partial [Chitinispirillaceae bacterium]|nr:PEGA domain-containing protein [Chitinispirillaceae bacterium]